MNRAILNDYIDLIEDSAKRYEQEYKDDPAREQDPYRYAFLAGYAHGGMTLILNHVKALRREINETL